MEENSQTQTESLSKEQTLKLLALEAAAKERATNNSQSSLTIVQEAETIFNWLISKN